jgi:hypothetical protein
MYRWIKAGLLDQPLEAIHQAGGGGGVCAATSRFLNDPVAGYRR